MVENQMKQPMDQLLHNDFYSRLGAWHTTYNPLKRIDSLQIVPTENDQFVRRQLLRGYVHDEAAAFQGASPAMPACFRMPMTWRKYYSFSLIRALMATNNTYQQKPVVFSPKVKSPTSRRGLGFDKPALGTHKGSPLQQPDATLPSMGHTGFTGTCFWVDPDNQLLLYLPL